MLDFELAELYGYETRYFNLQAKNNIEKFDESFMFQLTEFEWEDILRSKILTANLENNNDLRCKNFTANSECKHDLKVIGLDINLLKQKELILVLRSKKSAANSDVEDKGNDLFQLKNFTAISEHNSNLRYKNFTAK